MSAPLFPAAPLFRSPAVFADFPALVAAESTRHGGVSPAPYASLNLGLSTADDAQNVAENRRRFWDSLGIAAAQVVTTYQVHGAEVLCPTEPGHYQGFDALITRQANLFLAVNVADCTPVLIYDPVGKAVAAVHAGWRGTCQQIVAKTLARMRQEWGTDPANCRAYIGTCIDECSFEVGPEVAEHFALAYQRFEPGTQKYFIDLKAANQSQLLAAGVLPTHIEVSSYSTVLHNHDYFSHRFEKGITGRMLALIGFTH
ncbi:peptidoglycan editing factor PgeF [Rhabdobacter roseus]|uniref:Purine nucleoside phosphorylase n=1 Tax=Rhabdobacter roseus TaxID=1655419 RepID=A0A840TPJ5_9BACT|nr:peptidoglycan editing factor PgeF [Rhabdobacter roseus]MBB5285691.1 hypothetical protein [Rhabdobacter roseus]